MAPVENQFPAGRCITDISKHPQRQKPEEDRRDQRLQSTILKAGLRSSCFPGQRTCFVSAPRNKFATPSHQGQGACPAHSATTKVSSPYYCFAFLWRGIRTCGQSAPRPRALRLFRAQGSSRAWHPGGPAILVSRWASLATRSLRRLHLHVHCAAQHCIMFLALPPSLRLVPGCASLRFSCACSLQFR